MSEMKGFNCLRVILLCLSLILFSNETRAQEPAKSATNDAGISSEQSDAGGKYVSMPQGDVDVVTAKLVTWDTTPNDPGHIELDSAYTLTGAGKAWSADGNRHRRNLFCQHSFDETFYVGVVKNLDVFVGEGFAIKTDKENNYNEVKGLIDPDTGSEMEDETEGPGHGHGLKDLTVGGRWRFYHNEPKQLSFAYVPIVQIPIGRRSNFDHLGPSQGFTSMDNRLVVTKNFGRFNADFNLAYSAPLSNLKRTRNYCGTLNTDFALGYQLKRWIQPEIEASYSHGFEKNGKGAKLFSMVFGFLIPVNPYARFDIGMIQDVLGSAANQTTAGYFRLVLTT